MPTTFVSLYVKLVVIAFDIIYFILLYDVCRIRFQAHIRISGLELVLFPVLLVSSSAVDWLFAFLYL